MPRPVTSQTPTAVRCRARYGILTSLGYDSTEAHGGASNAVRFVELVVAKGRDPNEYGELSVRRTGGKPRVDTPRSRQYASAYRELRELGAGSAEATAASKSPKMFEELRAELLRARGDLVESREVS